MNNENIVHIQNCVLLGCKEKQNHEIGRQMDGTIKQTNKKLFCK